MKAEIMKEATVMLELTEDEIRWLYMILPETIYDVWPYAPAEANKFNDVLQDWIETQDLT